MAWNQLVGANTGVTDNPGWCLRFTQSVFGAPARYASATQAYNATQFRHADRAMPNVAVPIWFSWVGDLKDGQGRVDWGHVAAWVPGRGFLTSPLNYGAAGQQWVGSIEEIERFLGARYLGWSEDINGLRVVSGSGDAAPAPTAGRGDHIAAEGNDWTYWVPSTQDQATVQAGINLAGFSIPVDGNLASDASIRAIKALTGKFGFFDLRYFDGLASKNLCHGILLMARDFGGYGGRMDWQIDGHVWASFDAAIRKTAPAPAPAPASAPASAPAPAPAPKPVPATEPVPVVVPKPEPVPVVVPEPVKKPVVKKTPIKKAPIVKEPPVAEAPVNENVLTPAQYEAMVAASMVNDSPDEAGTYNLVSLGFWNYAGERVIKTFAMTFSSMLTATGAVVVTTPGAANIFSTIGWTYILSVAGISAVTSLAVALSSFKDIVTLKK